MVLIITYGTVIVQVAFPFTLLNRRVKNVLLAVMIAEHAGIAVLLGLPFFSLAMITADAVFLPTVFLLWTEGRVLRAGRRLRQVGSAWTRKGPRDSGGGGGTGADGSRVRTRPGRTSRAAARQRGRGGPYPRRVSSDTPTDTALQGSGPANGTEPCSTTTASASRSASGRTSRPWPQGEQYDPRLLAHGDRRNVVDGYRYWTREAIVADLDTRRHDFVWPWRTGATTSTSAPSCGPRTRSSPRRSTSWAAAAGTGAAPW